jgi:hypothetical protein
LPPLVSGGRTLATADSRGASSRRPDVASAMRPITESSGSRHRLHRSNQARSVVRTGCLALGESEAGAVPERKALLSVSPCATGGRARERRTGNDDGRHGVRPFRTRLRRPDPDVDELGNDLGEVDRADLRLAEGGDDLGIRLGVDKRQQSRSVEHLFQSIIASARRSRIRLSDRLSALGLCRRTSG